MKSPCNNSLLGWQELRHKDTPRTHSAPSLALGPAPVGAGPQEARWAGTKRQLLPWDLVSESQLSLGEDGIREMGFWVSRSDKSSLHRRGQIGQGAPPAGRWSGTSPRTTQAVK